MSNRIVNRAVLEREFEQELIETYKVAAKHGYHATYFLKMIGTHGGVETAKRLLADDQVQTGLFRLAELKILHISVENLVLERKYDELFLTSEKRAARERLRELGFEPGGSE